MVRIALIPVTNDPALANFERTVLQPVDVSEVGAPLPDRDRQFLHEAAAAGPVRLWGVKPGERGSEASQWRNRLRPGDYFLAWHGGAGATLVRIRDKFESETLGEQLWGETVTKNGIAQRWSLITSLAQPERYSVDLEQLGTVIGQPNLIIRGFRVLEDEPSERVLALLDLAFDTPAGGAGGNRTRPARQYTKRVPGDREFDQLDQMRMQLVRAEQAYLRQTLLNGQDRAECMLCGRELPVEFLVAGHIKPRRACNDEEKRDVANVAMLNCRLGCDELWGRGLICVEDDGRIKLSSRLREMPEVEDYARKYLRGHVELDTFPNPERARTYYAYHAAQEFRP